MKLGRRFLASWRKKDDGVINAIEQIAKTKQEAGIDTCFARELIRLAKNGLFLTTKGAEIDQAVMAKMIHDYTSPESAE